MTEAATCDKGRMSTTTASEEEFSTFVRLCRRAVGQQVSEHTEPFQSLWSQADDLVLIGAAGSHQEGWDAVSTRLTWASQHLNFGGPWPASGKAPDRHLLVKVQRLTQPWR
jgi:hypothetical protein